MTQNIVYKLFLSGCLSQVVIGPTIPQDKSPQSSLGCPNKHLFHCCVPRGGSGTQLGLGAGSRLLPDLVHMFLNCMSFWFPEAGFLGCKGQEHQGNKTKPASSFELQFVSCPLITLAKARPMAQPKVKCQNYIVELFPGRTCSCSVFLLMCHTLL